MALGEQGMKSHIICFAVPLLLMSNMAEAKPAAKTLRAVAPTNTELTAPGPSGPLGAVLLQHDDVEPLILIIPGSGPTDRDGNNPLGVTSASYRLLAQALSAQNVATLRIDKRGMFSSKAATPDANKVSIADYVSDVHAWVKTLQAKTKRKCVWLLGHSEGSLVALAAAQKQAGICGVISVAGGGRKLGAVMREQFTQNPANAPILPDALRVIDELEAGRRVEVNKMHPALQGMFAPQVQGFFIDLFAQDPAALAAALKLPILIAQGDHDLQVKVADAQALAIAQPKAKLLIVPGMTHVLKQVADDTPAANFATYSDVNAPVSKLLVDGIAQFVKR